MSPSPSRPRIPVPGFIRAASGWAITRFSAQILEFAAWVILANRLDVDDLGVVAIGVLSARYAGQIADWGALLRGPREIARHGRTSAVVSSYIRLRRRLSALTLGVLAAAYLIAGAPELLPMLAVAGGRGLAMDWVSLGEGESWRAGIPAVVQGFAGLAAVTVVSTTLGACLALGGAALVALALSLGLNRVRVQSAAESVAIDGWFMLASIADQLYASADTLLLAWLVSTADAGIYASIYRFPNAWISLVGLVVVGVLPDVTRALVADPQRLPAARRQGARVGAFAAATVVVPAAIAAYLIGPVFGEEFVVGRAALLVLFGATAVATASAPLRPLYVAVRSDKPMALMATATAVVNVGLNLVLIPRYGMVGAAIATLAIQFIPLGFFWHGTRPIDADEVSLTRA